MTKLPTDRDLYYHLERELHSQKDGKLPSTASSKLAQNFEDYADLVNNFPPLPIRYQRLKLKQDWFMHKSQRKRIVGRSWNNAEPVIHHYVMSVSSMVKNRHDMLKLHNGAPTSSCHETFLSSARMPVKTPEDNVSYEPNGAPRVQLPNQQKGAMAADLSLSHARSELMLNGLDLSNAGNIDDELNRLSAVVASVNGSKVKGGATISRIKNSATPVFNAAKGAFPESSRRRQSEPDFTYQPPAKRRNSNPDISFLDEKSCSEYNGINAIPFVRCNSSPEGTKRPSMLNQVKSTANTFLTDPADIYQNPVNQHKHPRTFAPSFDPSVIRQSNNDKSHNDLIQFVLKKATMNRGSQGGYGIFNDGLLSPSSCYPRSNLQKQPNLADKQQPNCTINPSMSSLDPSVRQSNNVMPHNDLFFSSYYKMQNAGVNDGSSAFNPSSSSYSPNFGLPRQKQPNFADRQQLNYTFNPSVSTLDPGVHQPNNNMPHDDLVFDSYNKMQNTILNRGSPEIRCSPDSFDSADNLDNDATVMYKDGFLSPVAQKPTSAAPEQPNYIFNRSLYKSNDDSSQDGNLSIAYNKNQNPSMNIGSPALYDSNDKKLNTNVMYKDRYSTPKISSAFDLPDNEPNQTKPNHRYIKELHEQLADARAWVNRTYGQVKPAWVTQTHGQVKPFPDDNDSNENK